MKGVHLPTQQKSQVQMDFFLEKSATCGFFGQGKRKRLQQDCQLPFEFCGRLAIMLQCDTHMAAYKKSI